MKALLVIPVLFAALTASAQFDFKKKLKESGNKGKANLQESAAFSAAEKKLQAAVKKVNQQCDLKLKGAFNKKSFAGKLKDNELKNLGGPACEEALIAFGTVCKKKELRQRIEKLKKYTCMYSASSKLKVKNDHFAALVNPTTSNIDKFKVDVLNLF